MRLARGSVALPRMNAYRLVIIAAALTTAVAAALAAVLATFSSQALPRAVRHDLGHAAGTSLVITGTVDAGQAAQYTSVLPTKISAALDGTAFAFYQANWSDPLGFAAGSPPAATQPGDVQIAEAAELGDVAAHAVLVSGRWPAAPPGGQPAGAIPAALPAAAAALLHVTVGDVLRMRDRISGQPVRFAVTGLYRPRQPSSAYWGLDEIGVAGARTASGFTTYGPLAVPAAAFAGPLAVYGASWLAVPATASVPAGRLGAVAANVDGLRQALQYATLLPDLAVSTSLPSVLDGTASSLDVARSLLAICAVLLFLLAAAALFAAARLLAGQREGETAMLAARGATRRQLAGLAAAEAVPVCLLSAAAGGAAGLLLAGLIAGPGTPGGGAWPAFLAAAAVGAGALVIMLVPAFTAVTPGAARTRRGRQAAIPGVTRAGADVALVLLALVAGWQLRHYSAVSAGANGNFGVDPVIVLAPALALAGGTVLALRLLPAGGRAGDRLAARGRGLTAAMASWQISRQPIRQGGAALLIVLAVATGTLALCQRQSWAQSDRDQAAFAAGADVRVQTGEPLAPAQAAALARAPGVRHAMPVAAYAQETTDSETLAVDASQAAGTALLRADQSPLPAARLFGKLVPAGPPPGVTLPGVTLPGVTLPGRAAAFRLTARLGPAALGLPAATVTVSVQAADGDAYQLGAGSLPADGRDHVLAVSLGPGAGAGSGTARAGRGAAAAAGAAAGSGASYPLRLTAISVAYPLPARQPRGPAVFRLDGVAGAPGTAPVPGAALRGWPCAASSPELAGARQTGGTAGPSGMPAVSSAGPAGRALTVTFSPGYGLASSGIPGVPPTVVDGQLSVTPAVPAAAIPGLATQRFLAASNASVGSTVQSNLDGAIVSVKIVAAVSTFPTVSGSGGGLVVDLGTLQRVLTAGSLPPAPVTQWWLATSGPPGGPPPDGFPPGVAASLPPGSAVTSTAALASGLLGDPLSTVPRQALLAVTAAAAVLAITGFCVSIAAGIRQRRAENALLAALGVAPRAAARQLCLEKLMLSGPAALAGLVLGGVLAELLVPAMTLSPAATAPVPPPTIQFGWPQTLALAAAVAVLPVLAAALTVARRPDAAAELRAADAA